MLNVASGATKLAASAQVISAISGKSIIGSGDGDTSIVVDSVTADLSQLPSGCTVQVIVIEPPHCEKLVSMVPGIVPLIAQAPDSPLVNVASGATKFAASSHVNGPAIDGMVITGSGAGVTLITTVSSTELLSHPVGALYVNVIVPPHSSKSASTVGVATPDISHTPPSPLVNEASGATKLAASLHVSSVIVGKSITGSGEGATSIVNTSTTGDLPQLPSIDGTVHVTVIVPPHCVKFDSTTPGTVPLISHVPVAPLLNVASGATKLAASSHVKSSIVGISIVGSAAGSTVISCTCTVVLPQSSVTVHVRVIVPPHSSKSSTSANSATKPVAQLSAISKISAGGTSSPHVTVISAGTVNVGASTSITPASISRLTSPLANVNTAVIPLASTSLSTASSAAPIGPNARPLGVAGKPNVN